MKHETIIGDDVLKEFANQIGNLRYDLLCDFINHLAKKLHVDATNDYSAGRRKLGEKLFETENMLKSASNYIADAWDICESKMP